MERSGADVLAAGRQIYIVLLRTFCLIWRTACDMHIRTSAMIYNFKRYAMHVRIGETPRSTVTLSYADVVGGWAVS